SPVVHPSAGAAATPPGRGRGAPARPAGGGAMKLPARQRPPIQLNLAPLVDVIFILLIFVVLVAKFADQERLDVTLPSAAAGRTAEVDALMIEVSRDGVIAVQGHVIDPADLEEVVT